MRLFALFALIFAVGLAAFGYSRTLPHMTDPNGFRAAYNKMVDDYYAPHASEDWHAHEERFDDAYQTLFKAHVTDRNWLKKYSLCALVLGIGGMLLFARGLSGRMSPFNKWFIPVVGLVAVGLSFWGFLADSNEYFGRGEAPMWDDEASRAFGGAILIAAVTAIVVLAHGFFLIGKRFNSAARMSEINLKRSNWFLLAELFVTALLTIEAIREGAYFSLLAAPLWFYFYLSLLAVRAKGLETKREM